MPTWRKETLPRENGETADMQLPLIVSASRSTDIPAFYADWFFHRLDKAGYLAWTNPFNGARSYVSFRDTRFIVFWSKNPEPLLPYLDILDRRGIGCYVQFSLNDYSAEGFEGGVPQLGRRIDTFRRLVDRLGKGRVVWRFDPLLMTRDLGVDGLLEKVRGVGDQLRGYTERLVFSFADIVSYRRVEANLRRAGVDYVDWREEDMKAFACGLAELNSRWGYDLSTCGERLDLSEFGVRKGSCVDDSLIVRFAYADKVLMDFLKVKLFPMPQPSLFAEVAPLPAGAIPLPNGTYALRGDARDHGQREFCGCAMSKDIGEYNTCVHRCDYCYANTSKEAAAANLRSHLANPFAETITGR